MNIIKKQLPIKSLRRPGETNNGIKYLVAHDTGNDGADASDNVNYYVKSANEVQASAHAFVDEEGIVECIPLNEKAWHVRYNAGIAPNVSPHFANDCAIGVELCYSTSGKFDSKKAYQNYCEYIAYLCETYRLDPEKDIFAHSKLDPTRRTDPMNAFSKIGKTWEEFIKDVTAFIATKHMETSIKFVKFYDSSTKEVSTYFTTEKTAQNDGQTFEFATADEMLSKSTTETFNFWDNQPVGLGKVTA